MTRPTASIVGALLLLLFPLALLADNDVEQLIQQSGVKEGPVAVRDLPGWEKPDKILVRELVPGLVDDLQQAFPGWLGWRPGAALYVNQREHSALHCGRQVVQCCGSTARLLSRSLAA